MHYHWTGARDGLRACEADDELAEPTFWVSNPPESAGVAVPEGGGFPDGWVDVGFTTDCEDPSGR